MLTRILKVLGLMRVSEYKHMMNVLYGEIKCQRKILLTDHNIKRETDVPGFYIVENPYDFVGPGPGTWSQRPFKGAGALKFWSDGEYIQDLWAMQEYCKNDVRIFGTPMTYRDRKEGDENRIGLP
jgi:hypothetical protein